MPEELHAAAQLLDRQLVDRHGRRCGKVDDLELAVDDVTGTATVVAIVCGPGALLRRTGHRRSGDWFRRLVRLLADHADADPGRIPLRQVADLGSHVTLAVDAEVLATSATERWVREHVIGHIPGSRVRAPG